MSKARIIEAIFGGLTMIMIGIVLLLNTTNLLPWGIWAGFIYLWPLLLIMGGLGLLIPDGALNKFVTGAMTFLIFIAVFVFGYVNFSGNTSWSEVFSGISWLNINVKSATTETQIEMPDADLTALSLNGELVSGTMLIHESHDQEDFIVASSEHNESGAGKLKLVETKSDSKLSIEFTQDDKMTGFGSWGGKRKYDISLAEVATPLNVDWEVISGNFTADIHHNKLSDSKVEVVSGVANLSLKKWVADSTLTVKLVAGKVSIVLPADSNIKINYEIVGGNLDVEDNQYNGISNGSVEIGDADGEQLTVNIEVVGGNAEVILVEQKQGHEE